MSNTSGLILEGLASNRINEASLGRLMQHIGKGSPIAFISASRNECTTQENDARYKELQSYVKVAHFGYNKVTGGYVEVKDDGSKVKVIEKSIAIIGTKEREKELRDLAVSLGKKYEQDSILFVKSDGNAYLVATRSDNSLSLSIGGEFFVGNKISPKVVGNYFSHIGNKDFEIKTVDVKVTEEVENLYGSLNVRYACAQWEKYAKSCGENVVQVWDRDEANRRK